MHKLLPCPVSLCTQVAWNPFSYFPIFCTTTHDFLIKALSTVALSLWNQEQLQTSAVRETQDEQHTLV